MLKLKHILHPTDFSAGAHAAFEHALHMARQFEAELQVMNVIPTFGGDPLPGAYGASIRDHSFFEELWEDSEQRLEALVEAHSDRDVRIRKVLARGVAPGPVIVEYAEKQEMDLIVMGTHGRRGVQHFLMGSVTEEVVHRMPCHVMTVRRLEEPEGEPRPVQRILAPVDFSDHASDALQTAGELAAHYGAQLDLLHVIKPLHFPVSLTTSLSIEDLVPDIEEKTRVQLEELVQAHVGPDTPADVHVRHGRPAQTIVDAARELSVDLIVMAPQGLSAVERFLLGSVTERVLRTASCPVFVTRASVREKEDPSSATETTATHE